MLSSFAPDSTRYIRVFAGRYLVKTLLEQQWCTCAQLRSRIEKFGHAHGLAYDLLCLQGFYVSFKRKRHEPGNIMQKCLCWWRCVILYRSDRHISFVLEEIASQRAALCYEITRSCQTQTDRTTTRYFGYTLSCMSPSSV